MTAFAALAHLARPPKCGHVAALGALAAVWGEAGCAGTAAPLFRPGTAGPEGECRMWRLWLLCAELQPHGHRDGLQAQHDPAALSLDGDPHRDDVRARVPPRRCRCRRWRSARRRSGQQADAGNHAAVPDGETLDRHDPKRLEPAEPGHHAEHVCVDGEAEPVHAVEEEARDRLAREPRDRHQVRANLLGRPRVQRLKGCPRAKVLVRLLEKPVNALCLGVVVRAVLDARLQRFHARAAHEVPVGLPVGPGEGGLEVCVADRRPRVAARLRADESDQRAED
mmetsp:Transcript_40862/g.132374  ORF Transcript_40862/g.132374 Transcript_40862/m.132374 type:complete len:281 (+) Transcript_40862:2497-3339(+)